MFTSAVVLWKFRIREKNRLVWEISIWSNSQAIDNLVTLTLNRHISYLFFAHSLKSIFKFFHFHPDKHAALCKCSKLIDIVKRNFFILTYCNKNLFWKERFCFSAFLSNKTLFKKKKKLLPLNGFVNKKTKTHVSVTVPVGRDRKFRTA